MKGIVFNVFEDFLDQTFGPGYWDEVLEKINSPNDYYIASKIYPDQELLSVVSEVITQQNLPLNQALNLFGHFLFKTLTHSYSDIVSEFKTPKEFMESLDSIIHVEVKKIMPGSSPPQFLVVNSTDTETILEYQSQRELCQLANGLMQGLNDFFNYKIKIDHYECKHRGDMRCRFKLEY